MRLLIFAIACVSAEFAATEDECATYGDKQTIPIKPQETNHADALAGAAALVAAPVAVAGTVAVGAGAVALGITVGGLLLGLGARSLYYKTGRLGAYAMRMLSWSSFQKKALHILRKALNGCEVIFLDTSSIRSFFGKPRFRAKHVAPTCIAGAKTDKYKTLCNGLFDDLMKKVNAGGCKRNNVDVKNEAEWSLCYLKERTQTGTIAHEENN